MKKVVLVAVAGVAALVALGYGTSLKALWNRTRTEIEQAKSAEQMIAEIEIHLADMDEKIIKHEVKLLKAQRQVKGLEDETAQLARARDQKVAQLKKARDLLSEDRSEYVIADRRWQRPDVEADVHIRIKELRSLQQQLSTSEAKLKALQEAAGQGQKVLADSRAQRSAKAAELQSLRLRLENAKQLAEIQEITRDLAGTGLTTRDPGFRTTWDNLLDRINELEVTLDNPNRNPGAINYEEPASPQDTLRAIDEALQTVARR